MKEVMLNVQDEIFRVYKLFVNSVGTNDITQEDLEQFGELTLADHSYRCYALGIVDLLEHFEEDTQW
jgi:hypothetical protein